MLREKYHHLNGHEWVKQHLARRHIRFQSLDDGFLACADAAELQAICDRLGPRNVQAFFDGWPHRLPWPMTPQDRDETPDCSVPPAYRAFSGFVTSVLKPDFLVTAFAMASGSVFAGS